MAGARDRRDHEQRTKHGAGLVHGGVESEAPTVTDLGGGFREQHVAGGSADAFAGALEDD